MSQEDQAWRPHTSLDNVRAIDHELASRWNICCRSQAQCDEWITAHGSKELTAQYTYRISDRSFVVRAAGGASPGQDAAWYDFMAHPLLNGPIHSERRPYILDACALAQAIIDERKVTGRILDVGCHSGYVASTLARLNPTLRVTGVDPSAPAIALAQAQSDLPANLEFVVSRCPAQLEGAFGLVLCVDSAPTGKRGLEPFVTWAAEMLADAGIVVFVGDDSPFWTMASMQKRLAGAGLGFILADVVGGWTGDRFESKLVLAFEKGIGWAVPESYATQATQGWDGTGFAEYSNSPETPWGEKTVQWFRAHRAAG